MRRYLGIKFLVLAAVLAAAVAGLVAGSVQPASARTPAASLRQPVRARSLRWSRR